MGLMNIQNGDYSAANTNMAGAKSFNSRVGQNARWRCCWCTSILDGSSDKDSAMGHYLAAIIAARQSNCDGVRSHLGMAVQKDGSLREKAMKDLEFRNCKDNLGL
jgi:hypothetical protein